MRTCKPPSETTSFRNQERRQRFFASIAASFIAGKVGLPMISETGMGTVEPGFLAGELVNLFDDTNNNPERERVMQIWSALAPQENNARRTLIDHVYISLLHQGKGAAKIALDYFALVETPPSTAARDRIRTAIKDVVKQDRALDGRAKDLQRNAGWIRGRLFRR